MSARSRTSQPCACTSRKPLLIVGCLPPVCRGSWHCSGGTRSSRRSRPWSRSPPSRWARLRTSRDGNQTSMIPSATPNRARCPTSCAWGSGLISGSPRSQGGYRNQGWRDAHDGVLDETGAFPELPIGTSEMQAYVYGAKTRIAALFEAWGDASRAALLRREAAELRRKFIATFWLEGA